MGITRREDKAREKRSRLIRRTEVLCCSRINMRKYKPSKARVEATSLLIHTRLREASRTNTGAKSHYFALDSEGNLLSQWSQDSSALEAHRQSTVQLQYPGFSNHSQLLTIGLSSLSALGDFYNFALSIGACVVYVVQTYHENADNAVFDILNAVIASLFAVDWIYHFLTVKQKSSFFWSKMTFIDMLTIIPAYIELFGMSEGMTNLSFFRMMRVFRVLRILRMYKLFNYDKKSDDDDVQLTQNSVDSSGISKQIAILAMTIFSLLFIGAGVVHSINLLSPNSYNCPTDFDFFAAFYYMIVTCATVGYGDIYPITTFSRMVTVALVVTMVFIIGDQLGRISQLMANYSKYDRYYNFTDHIVVMGFYTPRTLYRFLFEFYHPDHGESKRRCVIIGDQSPSEELMSMLETESFEGRVKYLEGKPNSESTLRKANSKMANAVFVMTDQQGTELEANDSNAMLMVKAVHDHAQFVKSCVQLVRPTSSLYSTWASWSTIVSTQEVKMGILGTAIHNPGFSTLLTGLHTSADGVFGKHLETEWLMQYVQGLSQEIYCVEISSYFHGKSFTYAVRTLYLNAGGILLIAVKTNNTSTHKEEVLINPARYTFGEGDCGYVICVNKSIASKITSFSSDQDTVPRKDISKHKSEGFAQVFKNSRRSSRKYKADIETGEIIELWNTDLHEKLLNHVVVFGSIEGFWLLVSSIRNYSKQAVCLVSSEEPDVSWNKLKCKFENIYYLKGSILNFQEIFNCAIEDSFAVIILTAHNKESFTPDSDAVIGAKSIEMCFPSARVLLELGDETYLRFLGNRPRGKFEELPYTTWPKYISGRCFLSSYLETLSCQCYYNPELVKMLLKLMGLQKHTDTRLDQYSENFLIRSIHVPSVYFKVENQTARTYGELFNDLLCLDPPVIPLGVFSRRYTSSVKEDLERVEFEVMFTNPLPTALVDKEDCLICIGDNVSDRTPGEQSRIENQVEAKTMIQDLLDVEIKESIFGNGKDQNSDIESVVK